MGSCASSSSTSERVHTKGTPGATSGTKGPSIVREALKPHDNTLHDEVKSAREAGDSDQLRKVLARLESSISESVITGCSGHNHVQWNYWASDASGFETNAVDAYYGKTSMKGAETGLLWISCEYRSDVSYYHYAGAIDCSRSASRSADISMAAIMRKLTAEVTRLAEEARGGCEGGRGAAAAAAAGVHATIETVKHLCDADRESKLVKEFEQGRKNCPNG